jgi:hypothetical protein
VSARLTLLVALLALGAGVGIGLLIDDDSARQGSTPPSCAEGELLIAKRCARLLPGKPYEPLAVTRAVARKAIDADPGRGQFRIVECTLEGVALREYEVFRCHVEYRHVRVDMRLVHDRRISAYRYEIVSTSDATIVPRGRGLCDLDVPRSC